MLNSSSTPDANQRHTPVSNRIHASSAGPAISPRNKGRETELRHQNERRLERLSDIREQIADGTLVVRQMTAAERADGYEWRLRPAQAEFAEAK
jgi:anti-sigma28 factor (negative regulator of flagellin synthesis)